MMVGINDSELLYLILEQNESAYNEFIRRYEKVIWSLIYNYRINFKTSDDKQDLFQSCLLLLHNSIYCYREDMNASFGVYFRSCLKKTILGYIRKESLLKNKIMNYSVSLDCCLNETENLYGIDLVENNQCSYDPVWCLRKNELSENFEAIYKSLKPSEKEVFDLRKEGFSYLEISEKLDISKKKIDNVIQKIRKKTKSIID